MYHYYFFVEKFPKLINFSDSREKSRVVELNIKENMFYGLQKILENLAFKCYVSLSIN